MVNAIVCWPAAEHELPAVKKVIGLQMNAAGDSTQWENLGTSTTKSYAYIDGSKYQKLPITKSTGASGVAESKATSNELTINEDVIGLIVEMGLRANGGNKGTAHKFTVEGYIDSAWKILAEETKVFEDVPFVTDSSDKYGHIDRSLLNGSHTLFVPFKKMTNVSKLRLTGETLSGGGKIFYISGKIYLLG